MHVILTSRGGAIEWSAARGAALLPGVAGAGRGLLFRQRSGWTVLSRHAPVRWGGIRQSAGIVTPTPGIGAGALFKQRSGWSILSRHAPVQWSNHRTGAAEPGDPEPTGNSRPVSDISSDGWTPSTGTALWPCIDEVTADTADYIKCTTTPSPKTGICGIAPALPPGTHMRRFMASTSIPGQGQIQMSLLDDSNTVLGSSGWVAIGTTPSVYEVTITIAATATRFKFEGKK